MKLTELFTSQKQITGNTKPKVQSGGNSSLMQRQIQALKPGQTVQGEVLSRNGNEVQIKVSEDMVLKARVDQNMNLEIGKNMTFEVKNNGQTLTLLPLYTNTATDANVLKALDMAALPVNQETIAMTEQMMRAGLSIDKNNLQLFYRECNMYPESNVGDIIDLHKLSMPVNETNLSQIASYKNLTHQMVNGFNEIINTLPDTMQGMLQGNETEAAARLFQDILNLISPGQEGSKEGTIGNSLESSIVFQENVQGLPGEAQAMNLSPAVKAQVQLLLDMISLNGNVQSEGELSQLLTGEGQNPVMGEGVINVGTNLDMVNGAVTSEGNQAVVQEIPMDVMGQSIGEESLLLQNGNEKPLSDATGIVNQNNAEALQLLQKLVHQGISQKDTALLQALLGKKEITDFVKETLQKQWTITPQDVADEGKVQRLYERLEGQLKGLAQALENAGQTHSETYKATTNLAQNVDFLQQLNQTYTYLQLPLRLQQGNNAHGDLYVYSRKKNLASSDGKITALLHLDMENLGPMDVYVAMQSEKVSTKFYLQDEAMLDFLAGHMDLLTERLRKRGYDYTCEMVSRENDSEKKETVVSHLLEKEPQVPIVQYAFDVRT